MRFPLPLSLHLARFPILHFLLFPLLPSPPFSYCSKISVSIFCLVIGSSAFPPLLPITLFLPRAFPVFSQVFLNI